MEKVPADFDWVTARAKCSAFDMFVRLRELAQRDATRRNVCPEPTTPSDRFRFHDSEDRTRFAFSIWDRAGTTRRGTDFLLDGDVIRIQPTEGEAFEATVTLTDEGDCKLLVGNEVRDLWQVLRRALEPLLFRP